MNPNYRTDAEGSAMKPAGPHLLERSADPASQSVTKGSVTLGQAFKVVVAETIRPVSRADTPNGPSQT